MRVHQLAKDLGIEPEAIMEILEARGESAKAVSSVSPEAEQAIRAQFSPATAASFAENAEAFADQVAQEAIEAVNLDEAPAPGTEEQEAPAAPGVERVAVPGVLGEWNELTSDDDEDLEIPLELADLDEADFVAKYGVDDEEFEAIQAGLEITPPEDRFAVVNENGTYRETLKLEPSLARKVEAILAGRKIESYCHSLERREFVFVTVGQKYRVPFDE